MTHPADERVKLRLHFTGLHDNTQHQQISLQAAQHLAGVTEHIISVQPDHSVIIDMELNPVIAGRMGELVASFAFPQYLRRNTTTEQGVHTVTLSP